MVRILLLFAALVGFKLPVYAAAVNCTLQAPVLEGDWRYHRVGEFIFAYALTGPHAIDAKDSLDDAQLPRGVSDAVAQLVVVRGLFSRANFQLPLNSHRYRSQGANKILVRFQRIQSTGLAYDEVTRLPSGECVLTMVLSTRFMARDATPAHEYFHLVQNGYAMFKRPWYYEGLARWAESSVARRKMRMRPLLDAAALDSLWGESYAAETSWNTLINTCTPLEVETSIFESELDATYRDGSSVLADRSWVGVGFVRRLLEELSLVSLRLSGEFGVPPYLWPESLQRHEFLDLDIWHAVERACEQSGGVILSVPPAMGAPGTVPDGREDNLSVR